MAKLYYPIKTPVSDPANMSLRRKSVEALQAKNTLRKPFLNLAPSRMEGLMHYHLPSEFLNRRRIRIR